MCGRYALALRPQQVRQYLQESNMPSDDAPEEEEARQSYNFAPGYHGLVYRADVPDYGAGRTRQDGAEASEEAPQKPSSQEITCHDKATNTKPTYKIQAMKWGLIPFWTKRNPDYGSMMRTINCRDDSLAINSGMWNAIKHKKRCIVVAQGFFEWQKKDDGKIKIPHFVKRKDGQLMCFAGLWDCAKFEGAEDKIYSYTIITTDSNKQLGFLHDRMPVILNNGSDELFKWLDPNRTEWSNELQSLLKPFKDELECYPVPKEVGKVGNNSPTFIVPIDSTENKQNIANYFGNHKKAAQSPQSKPQNVKAETHVKTEENQFGTVEIKDEENNAPNPPETGEKRQAEGSPGGGSPLVKKQKELTSANDTSPQKTPSKSGRQTRSATSNHKSPKASPAKASDGSQKITAFFGT